MTQPPVRACASCGRPDAAMTRSTPHWHAGGLDWRSVPWCRDCAGDVGNSHIREGTTMATQTQITDAAPMCVRPLCPGRPAAVYVWINLAEAKAEPFALCRECLAEMRAGFPPGTPEIFTELWDVPHE